MPKPANQEVLDATVRHQMRILRFSDGEAQASAALLAESDAELVALLQSGLTEVSEKRIRSLLADVRRMRAAVAERIGERLQGNMDDLAGSESDWESSMIQGAAPVALDLNGVAPSVLKAVSGSPINGIPLQGWLGKMATNDVARIEQQVRLGALAGETVDQMVSRIRGTKANAFKDGVLQTTRREAEMIARTAVNHVSTAARQATWEANADIIKGVRWVATLDGRTSPVCQSRDGHVYPIDSGPRPPAHPNCRSTVAPVLDGETIVGERPTVTDTRTRRAREVDFRKEAQAKAGAKWKDMSAAERNAAVKARRDVWADENIGQAPSTTNYQDWLRGQSKEFQDEVLGAGKAKLFRDGMPLEKFVDETGRPYSLQQLQAELAGDKLNVIQPGVGLKAKALLQQGLSPQEVLDQVKAEFPDASTSAASIASYKSELKKAGALDLPAAKVPSGQLKQAQSVQSVVDGLDSSLPAGVKHALGGQWSTVVGGLEGSPGAYGYYQAGKGVILDGAKLAKVPAVQARQVAAHELGHLLHKQHDLTLPDDVLAAMKAAAKQLTPDARKLYSYYLSSADELVAEVYSQAISPSAVTSQGLSAVEFNKAFEGAIDAAKTAMADKFPVPPAGALKPVPGGPVLPYEVAGKHTSVGSLAKALLQQGMPDQDVLDSVLAEFPGAKTKLASISSYKSELKKAGLLPNKASGPTVVAKPLPDVAPVPPPPVVAVASPETAALKPSAAALTEDELKAEAMKLFKSGVLKPVDVGSALNQAFPNAAVDLYPSTVSKWLAQFKGTQPGAYHNAVALAEKAKVQAAAVGPLKEPKLLGKPLGPTSQSALTKVKSYLAAGGDNQGAYDVMKSVFGSVQEPGASDLLELAKYDLATAKAAGKPYLDAAFKAPGGFEVDAAQEQFITSLASSPKQQAALDAYVTAKKHGLGPIKTNKMVKAAANGYEPSASFKVKLKKAADYKIAKEKAGLAAAKPASKPHALETWQPPKPVDLTPSRPASNPREGIPPPPRFTSAQRAAAIKKYAGSFDTAALDKINRVQSAQGLEAVTAEEAAAIRAYTGGTYSTLNNQLRGGQYAARHELQAFVESAQHGLAKMPKFSGLSSRGMRFSPHELEKVLATYRKGEVVTESAFVSSSAGEQAAFGGNVFMKIHGKTGVDVAPYSYYRREREVLFMPGTRFRVDKVEQINGKYIVEVTEV